MVSVVFVCLGNICRSPTAEGIFRHLVHQAGLASNIEIDSAGTAAYHAGEAPDRRSAATARRRGIELGGRARRFEPSDFERFDYVIAMDRSNFDALQGLADAADHRAKLSMLRDYSPGDERGADVPDPYYGGSDGFGRVFDICQAACEGLLQHIRHAHDL